MGKLVAEINYKRVVAARAACPPRGRIRERSVGFGCSGVVDGAVCEDLVGGLVEVTVQDLVVTV